MSDEECRPPRWRIRRLNPARWAVMAWISPGVLAGFYMPVFLFESGEQALTAFNRGRP